MKHTLRPFILMTICWSILPITGVLGESWTHEVSTLWKSKYVAEGRSDLNKGGIFTSESISTCEGFSFGAWVGLADSVDYKEIQLTAEYGFDWEGIEVVAGWTHIEFDPDSLDDDEVFLEASSALWCEFQFSIAGVYSIEADGSFIELALSYPFKVLEESLIFEPYILQGIDFGYRTEAYDGLNNLQLGLDLSYLLSETFQLVAFFGYSFAQGDVDREGLGDVSWCGLGLSATF